MSEARTRIRSPASHLELERRYLRLLQMAPFERRPGGWRFGTRVIDQGVIDRLVAQGLAVSDGAKVRMAMQEAAE